MVTDAAARGASGLDCTRAPLLRALSVLVVASAVALLSIPAFETMHVGRQVPTRPPQAPGSLGPAVARSTPTGGHAPVVGVGGHPHPNPPLAGQPRYSGHYYSGTVYSGANRTATDLEVVMTVPRDTPDRGDFYYVLLSAWDDAQSYDQLGFTSGSGVWGLSYSTTTPCAATYNFQTDAYNLTPGTSYRFDMSISATVVSFAVSVLGGATIWTHTQLTGGNRFVISQYYLCGGVTSDDYTDYEEVYTTSGPVPPYPFYFSGNLLDGSPVTTWANIVDPGAPSSITTGSALANVTIANTRFLLSCAPFLPTELDRTVRTYSLTLTVAQIQPDSALTLSVVGAISPSTFTLAPRVSAAPFTSFVNLSLQPTTPAGTYSVRLNATDTGGAWGRIGLTVVVHRTLTATTPLVSPGSVDVGQAVSFAELPSDGASPFQYTWSGTPAGCALVGSQGSCQPQANGTYAIGVTVVDALGFSSSSGLVPLRVSPRLAASVTANLSALDVGQSVAFSVSVSGGSGGTRVSWGGGASTCYPVGPRWLCTPLAPGPLQVNATVTDSNGALVSTSAGAILVTADPSATIRVDRPTIDLGASFTLRATTRDGAGSLRLTWLGLPTECASTDATTLSCRPTGIGSYSVSVAVVDANAFRNVSPAIVLTANPQPAVNLTGTAGSVLAGSGFDVVAHLSGGSGGFHYAWRGLPDDCGAGDSAIVSCTSNTPGHYVIEVTVTDAAGGNATGRYSVSVEPTLLGLPEAEGLGVLIGIAALVSIAIALEVRRRRRARDPTGRRERSR